MAYNVGSEQALSGQSTGGCPGGQQHAGAPPYGTQAVHREQHAHAHAHSAC